jgi:hypothetical protein
LPVIFIGHARLLYFFVRYIKFFLFYLTINVKKITNLKAIQTKIMIPA